MSYYRDPKRKVCKFPATLHGFCIHIHYQDCSSVSSTDTHRDTCLQIKGISVTFISPSKMPLHLLDAWKRSHIYKYTLYNTSSCPSLSPSYFKTTWKTARCARKWTYFYFTVPQKKKFILTHTFFHHGNKLPDRISNRLTDVDLFYRLHLF